MKNKENFVDLDNARPGIYKKVIEDIKKSSICPFCPENIKNIHKNPIKVEKFWLVTNNMYPYKPAKKHLLLIHKKHIENINDLTKGAWEELLKIVKCENKKLNIEGGTFMMRFGAPKYTGSSVLHLHCHLIQSDPDHPEYEKTKGIMTRVG
ncbi:MAG: HIT domain-containing protein [Candidatus Paceibacterota bacterium]|jgi:diadenosine tetraphosphate (Ap4A) HIT family hydrolase